MEGSSCRGVKEGRRSKKNGRSTGDVQINESQSIEVFYSRYDSDYNL
jgi:hypothetical protein